MLPLNQLVQPVQLVPRGKLLVPLSTRVTRVTSTKSDGNGLLDREADRLTVAAARVGAGEPFYDWSEVPHVLVEHRDI